MKDANYLVNKFNSTFPVGSKVHWRSVGKDGVPYKTVTVKEPAYLMNGQPVTFFEERRGCCSIEEAFVLYNIHPSPDETPAECIEINDLTRTPERDAAHSAARRDFDARPDNDPAKRYPFDVAFIAGWDARTKRPLDMIIVCPVCGKQHIDRPDPEWLELLDLRSEDKLNSLGDRPQSMAAEKLKRMMELENLVVNGKMWANPVHKSHTCRADDGGCGNIFRVADFPTNGVAEIKTRGEKDTWPEVQA